MIFHDEAATLAELCRWQARQRPQGRALIFRGEQYSYAELDHASNVLGGALLRAGVTAGTRIGHLARDCATTVNLLLACAKTDTVLVSINWRLTEREVAWIVEHAELQLLFVSREFESMALAVQARLPGLRAVVVIDQELPAAHGLAAFVEGVESVDPGLGRDESRVVVQMYTSGTTGFPKGVMLAHRSFFAVARQFRDRGQRWIGWSADDVSLCVIPLFHIGGLWWLVRGLASGAANVLLETFNTSQALRAIEYYRVSKTCLVPAMLHLLLSDPQCDDSDLSSLHTVVYGGSPIAESLLRRGMQRLEAKFFQIYGMTETGNMAVCLPHDDHLPARAHLLRAAGKALPGVDVDVFGSDGSRLPDGVVGEVRIQSPAVMHGYWKQDDATRQTLIDGWIHTGDAGYRDAEGYIFICDRIKDMISYAGENISPSEIENVLLEHPAIAEAAVIGIPDANWGESIKALLVRREPVTVRDIALFLRGRLADFKMPKSFDFVDSLPRTPSGKLQKAKLREPYWQGRDRKVN